MIHDTLARPKWAIEWSENTRRRISLFPHAKNRDKRPDCFSEVIFFQFSYRKIWLILFFVCKYIFYYSNVEWFILDGLFSFGFALQISFIDEEREREKKECLFCLMHYLFLLNGLPCTKYTLHIFIHINKQFFKEKARKHTHSKKCIHTERMREQIGIYLNTKIHILCKLVATNACKKWWFFNSISLFWFTRCDSSCFTFYESREFISCRIDR